MQWGLNVHQQPRQLDKRFSDLKLCQREQIAKWLREETNDYYTRHQRYPVGREAEDVVDNAYVQIVKAGIWIPYGEVYQLLSQPQSANDEASAARLNEEALHMCGRYFLADSDNSGELRSIIDQLNRRDVTVKTGEIFPTDTVPVLANNRNRRVVPFPMQWGYTLPDGRLLINARSETAGEKPLFQDAMRQHRCLIPATNYFEWEKRGREKIKYAIRQADVGLLYMAGLYRVENGRAVFTILTRKPAEQIRFIHDRMPVILTSNAKQDWLNLDCDAAQTLAQACENVAFCAVNVSC